MCPICGTLLELADSPQARREKAFVAELIAAGKSKAEIKDALVAEYGTEVLALPEGSRLRPLRLPGAGDRLRRRRWWRWRSGSGAGAARRRRRRRAARRRRPSDEDSERLDADIARYDL